MTGAWSPCGFSMVDTLAPHGYAGRLRTTLVACATFAAGALAGGVATFGGLALLGQALGAGGAAAIAVAAAVALAAAVGEARGARIVPQVRRQVPESWRRVLPVPLAAGLYGVLLGLGFTTFILTFAVWALAGVSVALGDPALGLLVGLGFGVGRALPVVVLAPLAGTERGAAAHAAMAERPAILRALRAADAVALAACAAALWAAPAQAATVFAVPATDPSADGALVAWQEPGGGGVLARPGGAASAAPGAAPRGRRRHARLDRRRAPSRSARRPIRRTSSRCPAAADAVAVSAGWVAWRARERRPRRAGRSPLPPAAPAARVVARAGPGTTLGRPALAGDRLLFHVAGAVAQPDRRDPARDRAAARTLRTRAARAAAQPVQRRPPAALRARDLPAPAAADRPADAPRRCGATARCYGTVPTGRRDAGHEPGVEHHAHGYPQQAPAAADARRHVTLWSTALAPGVRVRDAAAPERRAARSADAAARAALTQRGRALPTQIFAGEAR